VYFREYPFTLLYQTVVKTNIKFLFLAARYNEVWLYSRFPVKMYEGLHASLGVRVQMGEHHKASMKLY
jgi:hypothetical protein